VTVWLAGVAERLKSGVAGALTVRLVVAVWVVGKPVPVPVTVIVYGPALLVVVGTVSVEDAAVVGLGENVPLKPVGELAKLNVTSPAKLPVRVILTV
jgi:hypothetical protein